MPLTRTPPAGVRRQLRSEVRFGCPIKDCGNPYLEYHHFDPPWHVEQHHDPARMVALCATHHAQADGLTVAQCRDLKQNPFVTDSVAGRFLWMRNKLLAVVGGNFYYEVPTIFAFNMQPLLWFNRDEDQRLLLNFIPLVTEPSPRTSIEDNDWLIEGEPSEVYSPPKGDRLKVFYPNGDNLSVRFREFKDAETLAAAYDSHASRFDVVEMPITVVEITFAVGGTDINFGPRSTTIGGGSISGSLATNGVVGINITG